MARAGLVLEQVADLSNKVIDCAVLPAASLAIIPDFNQGILCRHIENAKKNQLSMQDERCAVQHFHIPS